MELSGAPQWWSTGGRMQVVHSGPGHLSLLSMLLNFNSLSATQTNVIKGADRRCYCVRGFESGPSHIQNVTATSEGGGGSDMSPTARFHPPLRHTIDYALFHIPTHHRERDRRICLFSSLIFVRQPASTASFCHSTRC